MCSATPARGRATGSQAEDITSETFFRAFRAIHNYRPGSVDIGAWFITIARNLSVDYVKSSHVRRELLVDDPAALDAPVAASAEHQVMEVIGSSRCAAPSPSSPDLREAILLAVLGGMAQGPDRAPDAPPHRGRREVLRTRALRQLRTALQQEAVAS